jgi:hypothetical protein
VNITATTRLAVQTVTDQRLIRPPDPAIRDETLRYAPYGTAEAVRRFIDLAFRDCHTAIDLTHARGGFWQRPYPPGLTIVTNNLDPSTSADLHLDFRATGLPDDAYDLAVIDPPHLADLSPDSIMGPRFGTVKGTPGLDLLVRAGVREALRIARIGILVKLADTSHGGLFLQLSQWVYEELGVAPYFVAHTYRPRPLRDGKWRVQRVPRNNGAVWLLFRKDGGRHRDFDRLYELHQRSRLASVPEQRHCQMCDAPLGGRRRDATTCSNRCRKRAERQRWKVIDT